MDYFCWLNVLGVLFIKTVSCQFPTHMDLHKVGQIQFRGETYNVLKPTVHEITDHFKDYMLRRDTRTGERVFIDDDGFRHRWKGFGFRENLRKSEKDIDNIVKHNQVVREHNNNIGSKLQNEQEIGLPGDAADYLRENSAAKKAAAAIRAKTAAKTKVKAAATIKTKAAATTKSKAAATTKAKAPEATKATVGVARSAVDSKAVNKVDAAGTRTAAKTYFFCPFLGVISMEGFID